MTNEHNFKVGDKVATTKPYDIAINGNTTTIPIGEEGVIENVDGEELLVDFPAYYCALTLMANEVEPIQPLDRRTAFLTRLQSLLREFDAHIEPCGCEVEGLSIVLKDNEEIYYKMDDFSPMRNLTADNIFPLCHLEHRTKESKNNHNTDRKMKTELTIEESAKLIELGVDPKMASTGRVREDEHTNKVSFYPIFTLTDLLAILPGMLIDRYGKNNPLGMEFDDDYMAWTAYYLGGGYVETQTELIDALNQLLIWTIENEYINLKTNNK